MMAADSFELICSKCQNGFGPFRKWIYGQRHCPACGNGYPFIRYSNLEDRITSVLDRGARTATVPDWLAPVLPIKDPSNLLPQQRRYATIERWSFLEQLAERNGVPCTVYAHRFDNIPSTGTVKDLAGQLVASVCREYGVESAVVASTGNIAVALSRFLAQAGIRLYSFLPRTTPRLNVSEIACYGQTAYVVDGDYSMTKLAAEAASKDTNFYFSPNGWDPIRIEAKKTIAYEWYTQLPRLPSVYIQALSGGMGPIGIDRGLRELRDCGYGDGKTRFLLAQTDGCNPMATAWKQAASDGFRPSWETTYPVIQNPDTIVNTISTGDPRLYPIVGPIVRESGGMIFDVPENELHCMAYHVARNAFVRIGPSSAVAVLGFLRALKSGWIQRGDDAVVAIGEGARRSPEFFVNVADGHYLSNGRIPDIQNECPDRNGMLDDILERL